MCYFIILAWVFTNTLYKHLVIILFFFSSIESSNVHENKNKGKTKGLDDMVIMQVPNHYYSISTYTFMRHILYSNLDAKWQFIKTQADIDH